MIWILALISSFICLDNALAQPVVGWVKKIAVETDEKSGDILCLPDGMTMITGFDGQANGNFDQIEMFTFVLDKQGRLTRIQRNLGYGRKAQEMILATNG